tara:strand:- start:1207 stop:1683 length:477 start_codon:yes stop_codon:yes gene_type:complete
MTNNYWLFKSEPTAYSYQDLLSDEVAEWDGVRNFQARNFLRDQIKSGDSVLFYHSNTKPPSVIGTATVVKDGYPDHTAWDPNSEHPDPKSSPENPIWYMVDIAPLQQFRNPVALDDIKSNPDLSDMLLIRRGMRLSVQPITELQYQIICEMGGNTKNS